ncbi:MAG: riboflavin kinase [Acidimicrobiales bacterium]|nr:riboflavin kinase [Acidimicrobiales bacterium]
MEIRRELQRHDPMLPRTALTIGAYDGVHSGHRQVIAAVRRLAAERSMASAVLTFDRHPASVVRPESAPLLLTDSEQKLEQLASTGVDLSLVLSFDETRVTESAEEFVRHVLVDCAGVGLIVVGEDFHFGHRRHGNVSLLREMGADLGFEVFGIGLVGPDGSVARDHEQVSSTFIRRALARGDLERANAMLGRTYEVRGLLQAGNRRDPASNFGMANFQVDKSILLPEDAVYAGWCEEPDSLTNGAVISVGTDLSPDGTSSRSVEVFCLETISSNETEFKLCNELTRVRFVRRLRSQRDLKSSEAWTNQFNIDVSDAQAALG